MSDNHLAVLGSGGFDAVQGRAREGADRISARSAGAQDLPATALNATIANHARVHIQSSADIVVARQQGRALASLIGFSSSNTTMIAAAISEVARNIVEYAKEGDIAIAVIHEGSRTGVKIVASDEGPGIPDLAAVMRDGFSTGQGLGIGLPGARRLMDEFEIASEISRGTTITMKKWL